MARNSAKLLNDLVVSLVDAYGADAVREALAKAEKNDIGLELKLPISKSNRSHTRELPLERRGRAPRPSAVDLIHKYPVSSPKRQYVALIAERFDRKQFLPSAADAREFLILSGAKPGNIKDRSDAFRQVLSVLVRLPTERLENIAHSGPSQLSTISDAIGSISEEMRQRRETP